MDNVVQFGAVVVNSSYSKKVQINNLGDTAVKYQWLLDAHRQILSISPEVGILQPQTDFFFEVAFHPKTVKDIIKITGIELQLDKTQSQFLSI